MKRSIVFMAFSTLLIFSQICFSAPRSGRSTVRKTVKPPAAATTGAGVSDSSSGVVSPAVPAEPVSALDFKKEGDLFTKKGLTEKAIESYKKSLELAGSDTGYSRPALAVGKYYYAQQQYAEALSYFIRITGKDAEVLTVKSMKGDAYQRTGNNDSAIALLEQTASNQKIPVTSRKDMFRTLGNAYLALKNDEIATGWYAKYVQSGGAKNGDIAYLLAAAQAKTAPAKAVLSFDANIKSYPADYRNYLASGMLQSKNKATAEKAIVLLKKAVSLADTIPKAWLEIARIYEKVGKSDEAIDAYRNAIRLDDTNLDAKMSIGSILLDKGITDEAIEYLEKANKQAPDSLGPMTLLAAAYTRSSKPKKAIDLLVKIKAANPADVTVRKQLFDAYQSSNQDQKAFEEIQGVLELERDREALFPYANMLLKMEKFDEAVAALEEILGSMPDDFEALMLLASVYRQQKKFDEAVEIYKQIGAFDAKFAPALYERAEVHLEQGKVKWAEMFYQRAQTADPGMALVEVGFAKIAQLFNKKDECNDHLSKAQSMAPDDPVVLKEIEKVRNQKKSEAKPAVSNESSNPGESDNSVVKEKKRRRK